MEHIVPKLVIRNKFVPILYLLMEHFVPKVVFRTFFVPWSHLRMEHNVPKLIGQDYCKDCFVPIYLSAYKPAWASFSCISLS